MSTFKTKFTLDPRIPVAYDPYDKVDRLTYLDTTVQITRMMQAGVNLALRKSQVFPPGDDNGPCTPVFDVDPAVSANMIKEYKDALKARAEALRAKATTDSTDAPPVEPGAE